MKINTEDIVKITRILCQHLEDSGCEEINLPQLSYWAIPKEHEYDAYTEPTVHTLGNLEDDWSQLGKIIEGTTAPVGYGLVWLGSVLRAVGQNVDC